MATPKVRNKTKVNIGEKFDRFSKRCIGTWEKRYRIFSWTTRTNKINILRWIKLQIRSYIFSQLLWQMSRSCEIHYCVSHRIGGAKGEKVSTKEICNKQKLGSQEEVLISDSSWKKRRKSKKKKGSIFCNYTNRFQIHWLLER